MTDGDKEKWDARYAELDQAVLTPGSDWVDHCLSLIAGTPTDSAPAEHWALDVACGRGRHSQLLAAKGYWVDAIDISAVGLAAAEQHAQQNLSAEQASRIRWQCEDLLAEPDLRMHTYQVVVQCFFVAPQLTQALFARLPQGGWLILEQHLQWHEETAGPKSNRFRVASGELLQWLAPNESHAKVVDQYEGLANSHDGRQQALSRLLVQRV